MNRQNLKISVNLPEWDNLKAQVATQKQRITTLENELKIANASVGNNATLIKERNELSVKLTNSINERTKLENEKKNLLKSSSEDEESHRELLEQIDLLEQELKGEKQMGQTSKQSYEKKMKILKDLLDKEVEKNKKKYSYKIVKVDYVLQDGEELVETLPDGRLNIKYVRQTVDAFTQTELTYTDIIRMEKAEGDVKSFVEKSMFLNEAQKQEKEDIIFKLDVIERGIASIEEDKKHSETQGQEMKKKLDDLKAEIDLGKLNETNLKQKVDELKELIKRKETEYQKSLRVKEEDWQNITKNLNERLEKAGEEENDYKRKLEEFCEDIKKLENLEKDKTEQIRTINECKENFETEKKQLLTEIEELKQQISKTELTEKELTEKSQKIKELEKKMGEQSYLISDLNIYRKSFFVPVLGYYGALPYSFAKDGYLGRQYREGESYLTRHVKKKIIAFVFQITKLFGSPNKNSESDYDWGNELYSNDKVSLSNEEWNTVNKIYASDVSPEVVDLRFLVDKLGFQPQTYIFMKDFFDKAGGIMGNYEQGINSKDESELSYSPYRWETEIVRNNARTEILFKTVSYVRGGTRPTKLMLNSQADWSQMPIMFYAPNNSFQRVKSNNEHKIFKIKYGREPQNDYRYLTVRDSNGKYNNYYSITKVNFSLTQPQLIKSRQFDSSGDNSSVGKAHNSKKKEDEYKITASVNFNPPF